MLTISCPCDKLRMPRAELSLGQMYQAGARGAFGALQPRWHGLGLATSLLVFVCASYYNLLMVYSLIYMKGALEVPHSFTCITMIHDQAGGG